MSILTYFQPSKVPTITYDIFTDGSEIKNQQYKTIGLGYAYIIKKNKETIQKYNNIMSIDKNNQRAELKAILESLQCIKQIIHTSESIYINIYTDSEYALKCITTWCNVWKSNNWKTSKNKPVKNKDIIILCIEIMSQIKSMVYLSLHHVKSHTKKHDYIHIGNNEADELAKSAYTRSINN